MFALRLLIAAIAAAAGHAADPCFHCLNLPGVPFVVPAGARLLLAKTHFPPCCVGR
jgi:hypothetical protein